MDQPLFPLETYPFPIRTMAVRSMRLRDVIRYSFSSPTAARIVKEANIHLDGVSIKDCFEFLLESEKSGSYRICFVENWKTNRGTPLVISDGVFENTLLSTGTDGDECLIKDKNEQHTIINRYFTHFMTVFSWNANGIVIIISGQSLSYIQSLFQLDRKRTVFNLYLIRNWSADEFRHVMNGLNVTETVDLTGVCDCDGLPLEEVSAQRIVLDDDEFPTERLSILRSPQIAFEVGEKGQFSFIINKWASGEAFHNLEYLHVIVSDEESITYGTLLENIETKEWDPKRRPGYRCEFNDDGVELFEDLRKAVDVFRPDGKFATIFIEEYDEESGIYGLHAHVWKEEELVWTGKEDKKKMREMLKDHTEEYDEEKEKIEELNKVKEVLEKRVKERARKMDMIRDCLSKMSD